jgi:hypothetical protein
MSVSNMGGCPLAMRGMSVSNSVEQMKLDTLYLDTIYLDTLYLDTLYLYHAHYIPIHRLTQCAHIGSLTHAHIGSLT